MHHDPLMSLLKLILMPPFNAGVGSPVDEDTIVYRIEMPNGRGPYNSKIDDEIYHRLCNPVGINEQGQECWDCISLAAKNNEQCGITDQDFEEAHGSAVYACDSLQAIENWFPKGAREYLSGFGAKIVVFKIPKGQPIAVVGHGEIIMSKITAIEVDRLDVVTFETISIGVA